MDEKEKAGNPYSILMELQKNSMSMFLIIMSIVVITLFAYLVPFEIQKYAFFFFGIPVLYASLAYNIFYGMGVAVIGFGIHVTVILDHIKTNLAAGNFLGAAVEGVIIEILYFICMLFIAKVMINEREAQLKYRRLAENYAGIVKNLTTANEGIKTIFTSTITALAAAIDAKDTDTKGHSERVTRYAVAIAREMNLPEETTKNIMYGAILHDIGKIGIQENILNKPESLNSSEYDIMKKHPEIGASIVSSIKILEPIVPIVLHHHEYYNGKGYPLGLAGEEIPLGARIVAVADAYDAITSQRPYREPGSMEKALEALKDGSGQQFDPEIIEALIRVLTKLEEKAPAPVDF